MKRAFLLICLFASTFSALAQENDEGCPAGYARTISPATRETVSGEFPIPGPIQRRIHYLRTSGNNADSESVAAFDLLIQKLQQVLRPKNLENEIAKSELSPQALESMKKHSLGFATMPEALNLSTVREGYALGYVDKLSPYPMLNERMGLTNWDYAYHEFNIDWQRQRNHTELFMDKVTSQNKPVVFFVPNKVLTHPDAGVTKKEMEWLLRHPERMKNVKFVFGAYDSITPEMEKLRYAAGLSTDELRALYMRAIGHKGPNTWDDSEF